MPGADSRNSRRHRGNAVALLTPRASAATHQLYQRDALLDGIWLSRAHAGRSELEQACEVGRTVLEWLPHVDSTELDRTLQLVA